MRTWFFSLSELTYGGVKWILSLKAYFYLYNVEKISFKQKVLIGDKFNIETKLLSWKRGIGKCYGIAKVNNKKAKRGTLSQLKKHSK